MEAGSETTTAPERRRNRRRTVGYMISVVLWVLVLPPLSAQQIEEGKDPAELLGAWTALVVFTLGGAALIRFLYGLIRKRPVMSPWLFVLAAVLGVISLAGSSSGT